MLVSYWIWCAYKTRTSVTAVFTAVTRQCNADVSVKACSKSVKALVISGLVYCILHVERLEFWILQTFHGYWSGKCGEDIFVQVITKINWPFRNFDLTCTLHFWHCLLYYLYDLCTFDLCFYAILKNKNPQPSAGCRQPFLCIVREEASVSWTWTRSNSVDEKLLSLRNILIQQLRLRDNRIRPA